METSPPDGRQPVFNVPNSVLLFLVVCAGIHVVRTYLLSYEMQVETLLRFAFIPGVWSGNAGLSWLDSFPYWSPITYSFLHGDWLHLGLNALWMVAFGAVVAKRLGVLRFALLCIAGSCGGAAAHFVTHTSEIVPMIGASAVVSACVGAAIRFAFPREGGFRTGPAYLPRLSLVQTFTSRQLLAFIGFWFVINYVFGSGVIDPTGEGQSVAWQAHIGGFLVGILGFAVFDPVKR